MGVLGENTKRRQVIFVIDASTALSGIFNHLLTEYVVPCIEHFNGGPCAEKSTPVVQGPSSSCINYYGIITIKQLALFSIPSCNYYPITSDPEKCLTNLKNICFEGNMMEHCCRISEGLAAALEFVEITKAVVNGSTQVTDTDSIDKHCIVITNLPPSPMPVMESITYGNMNYMQLAEEMAKKNINLSVITPRWLIPYADLFVKGAMVPPFDNTALSIADHALHPGCMVLLRGFEVPSLRARKVKPEVISEPPLPPSTSSDQYPLLEDIKGEMSAPPSISAQSIPSLPPPTHSDSITNPLSVPGVETPPISSIRKTASVSSLYDNIPGPAQPSPKSTSPRNPASVPAIQVSDDSAHKPILTSSGNTFLGGAQRVNNSLVPPPFSSSLTLSSSYDTSAPVGSSTNPIQISSPGIEHKPFTVVTSVTTATVPPPLPPNLATSTTSISSSLSSLLATPLSSALPSTTSFNNNDSTTTSSSTTVQSAAERTAQQIVMQAALQANKAATSNLPRPFVPPFSSSTGGAGVYPSSVSNYNSGELSTGQLPLGTQPPSLPGAGTLGGGGALSSQTGVQKMAMQPGQVPMSSQGLQPGPGQVPMQQGQVPMQQGQVPMQQGQVSMQQQGQVSMQQSQVGQVPMQQGQPVPMQQGQVPMQQGQIPMQQQGQVPIQQSQVPMQQGQVPMQQGQVPMQQQGQVPMQQQGQVPMQQGQIPIQQGQVPMQQGQVPMQQGQVPMQQGQVSMQQGQVPIQQQQPMSKLWTGYLETIEYRQQRPQARQTQCTLLASKPETAADIKPDLWPSKLTMSVYPKQVFNAINSIVRINQTPLRTVQFQFMEQPQSIYMLKLLMNSDPQNKKVAIVKLAPVTPQCPIKAFFVVWNDKCRQFTGLIPLEQENFVSALKQVLTKSQQSSVGGGVVGGGVGQAPFISGNNQIPSQVPPTSTGGLGGGVTPPMSTPYQGYSNNSVQQPVGGGAPGQTGQQQSYSASSAVPQLPVTTTPLTSSSFMSSQGGGAPLINPANPIPPRPPMVPSTGGLMNSQQQQIMNVLQNNEKFRQAFEKATPEHKQLILARLEQKQQQQLAQQQQQLQQYQQQQQQYTQHPQYNTSQYPSTAQYQQGSGGGAGQPFPNGPIYNNMGGANMVPPHMGGANNGGQMIRPPAVGGSNTVQQQYTAGTTSTTAGGTGGVEMFHL